MLHYLLYPKLIQILLTMVEVKQHTNANTMNAGTQVIQKIIQTTRIGISKAKDLPWRWYLQNSRSVSKRAKNDRVPISHQDSQQQLLSRFQDA